MYRFVISAMRSNLTQEANLIRHADLVRTIESVFAPNVLKLTVGRFHEEQASEPSIEAGVYFEARESAATWETACSIASRFEQDSILVINDDGYSSIVSADRPTTKHVGYWRKVLADVARRSGCWTYMGGEYYVCV